MSVSRLLIPATERMRISEIADDLLAICKTHLKLFKVPIAGHQSGLLVLFFSKNYTASSLTLIIITFIYVNIIAKFWISDQNYFHFDE